MSLAPEEVFHSRFSELHLASLWESVRPFRVFSVYPPIFKHSIGRYSRHQNLDFFLLH